MAGVAHRDVTGRIEHSLVGEDATGRREIVEHGAFDHATGDAVRLRPQHPREYQTFTALFFSTQADLKVGLYMHLCGRSRVFVEADLQVGLERVRGWTGMPAVDSPLPIEGVSQGLAVQGAGVHWR